MSDEQGQLDELSLPGMFPETPFCPLERKHITLSPETVELLRGEIQTAMLLGIQQGIQQGIKQAVTPELVETLWGVFFAMAKAQTARRTGLFVLGGLSALARRGMWLALIAAGLTYMVGWTGMVTITKVIFAGGRP